MAIELSTQITNYKTNLKNLLNRYHGYSLGAKGLIHAIQKDIIQNSAGAVLSKKKYTNWKVTFELIKIEGNFALSVTDQGTTGLTGGVFTNDKISELSASGNLGEDQNLSRFLNNNFTGGNTGAGSMGQGKGLFHLLSKNYEVVFDTLRNEGKEDESYVCGRKIMRNVVLQNELDLPDDPNKPSKEANYELFNKFTNNELQPLKKQGTRIIIKNIGINDIVKDVYRDQINIKEQFEENEWLSFVEVFINSFKQDLNDPSCMLSFKNMILETWWEILRNYSKNNAKIVLKYEDKEVEVIYKDSIIEKIYEPKTSKDITIEEYPKKNQRLFWENGNKKFEIKKIKLIHLANKRPGLTAGCFVQRKKMKIGEIIRNHEIIPEKFKNNFFSWVTLSEDAENEIHQAENETHYGFNVNKGGCKKLRKEINDKLGPFTDKFVGNSRKLNDSDDGLLNSFRAISHLLSDVGSFSDFSTGTQSSNIKIKFLQLDLPENTPSVDFVKDIGPVKVQINNPQSSNFEGKIKLSLYQNDTKNILKEDIITVPQKNYVEYTFSKFKIPHDFTNGRLYLKVSLLIGNQEIAKNTRLLFLNVPVPELNEKIVKLRVENPILPTPKSSRIDLDDEIKNLSFSFYSTATELLDTNVRVYLECRNEHNSPQEFHELYNKNFQLKHFVDNEVKLDDLLIDEDVFGFFRERESNEMKREIRMIFKIESNAFYPNLGLARGQSLSNSTKKFYFELDTSGKSIFKNVKFYESDDLVKSRISGSSSEGYICEINSNINELKNIYLIKDDILQKEFKEDYEQREIIRQAIMVCLKEDMFDGNVFNENSYKSGPGRGETYSSLIKKELFRDDLKNIITLIEEIIDKLISRC